MTHKPPTFIFDLDGVITKTETHHFNAWKKTATFLDYTLTPQDNESLKGVSRVDSLKKILSWAEKEVSPKLFDKLLEEKNQRYLDSLSSLSSADIMPGVRPFMQEAKANHYKIALYSSSKNARTILTKLNILSFFDALVDGNDVKNSKPDPEGFELAAKLTQTLPRDSVVFEDSQAGIRGAKALGMKTVGIGDPYDLSIADRVCKDFTEISLNDFII